VTVTWKSSSRTAASATTRLVGDQLDSRFGFSVAGAGDVNGDGYGDVIVGAVGQDGPAGYDEGAAFVFHGSASGIADGGPATATARLSGNAEHALLGLQVAGAGDVNGDGFADVLASGQFWGPGYQYEFGKVLVFHGSASGIGNRTPATAATRISTNSADAGFGRALAGAGDVNGDGYDDLIAGAPYYRSKGAAFVFLSSASGMPDGTPANAATEIRGTNWNDYLGASVAGAGDVNGDGYGDVIVGDPNYQNGAAFVFIGSASGVARRFSRPRCSASLCQSSE